MSAPISKPPSELERLLWWLAILLSGFVPLALRDHATGTGLTLIFPFTLGFAFIPLLGLLPDFLGPFLIIPVYFFGPVFYVWHLITTLRALTRARFDFLLVWLCVAVLLNQWILTHLVGTITN